MFRPRRVALRHTGHVRQTRTLIDRRLFELPPMPKAPPIRTRLKPLIPFLITWTVITSLAVHLLRERKRGENVLGRAYAKESVLEELIERFRGGEVVPDTEIRRELELVGLREKAVDVEVQEARKVGWKEMFLGRDKEVTEADAEEEWRNLVRDAQEEASQDEAKPATLAAPPPVRSGVAKRAESAKVFL